MKINYFTGASVLSLTAIFSSCQHESGKADSEKNDDRQKPNIIFIMADDLGYADLGCYGQQEIQTPNIDKLAKEGIKFTQCYAGSTVSAPSRSVLMTGLHTGHTTVRGNFSKVPGLVERNRVPLKEDDITIAEILKKAGYSTGITGKWGLGEPNTSGVPNKQGFDEWLGYLNQRNAHTYYPPYIWRNQEKMLLKGNKNHQKKEYTHDMFTQFALKFIQEHHEKPFFLYIPYCIPHSEYEIPSLEPYSEKPWSDDEKAYAAMVTRMDSDVGKIIELLKSLHLSDKTYVFFCSDNGAAKFWKGLFNSSGELRGRKRDMYEGGIRVPMIVWSPGNISAGEESDFPWYFADVLPTLANLAGVSPPEQIDGINVLPAIHGKKQTVGNRFMYWEFHERGFQQAARWKHWKAIRPAPGDSLLLFDLSKDISETNNLASENPQITKKIENYLQSARFNSVYWPDSLIYK